MDGVLIDLLNAKWNTFVKFKFYRQFFTFAFYFLLSLVCFTLRPGPPGPHYGLNTTNVTNVTIKGVKNNGLNISHLIMIGNNISTVNLTSHSICKWAMKSLSYVLNSSFLPLVNMSRNDNDVEEWWDSLTEECRLMNLDDAESKVRVIGEITMTLGAFVYLASAIRELRFLGARMFFENLVLTQPILWRSFRFINRIPDDRTVACYVPILLHINANNTGVKNIVRRWNWRRCCDRYNVNNSTLLLILLQVTS